MTSKILTDRLSKDCLKKAGISADAIKHLVLDGNLKKDILGAIGSAHPPDIRMGFFFTRCLLVPGKDSQFENALVDVSQKLINHDEWDIRENCISIISSIGINCENYRGIMLKALQDKAPMVRKAALTAYRTFSKPGETKPLESFEKDDYATELGMGSYLIYELRNQALETIEFVINKKFNKVEKIGFLNGKAVYWWDWEPFHTWKGGIWRKIF